MADSVAVKVAKMEKDVEYIKTELGETKELIKEFIDKADTKYASKTTEKVVYGMVGTILTAVLLAILYMVIK